MNAIEREVWGWTLDRERDYLPSPDFRQKHPDFPQSFRNILIDWIFEVSQEFKLHRETTHLSINYLDRYLSTKAGVKKSKLQLLGITSLFIAAKLEEIYPPNVRDFSAVTDGLFTFQDIHAAELEILDVSFDFLFI
jgi:cyclin E